MFCRLPLMSNTIKPLCISIRNHQVTVLGGASDLGQTICLLLRTQPNVTKLVVHDNDKQTPGVVLDLSHVPTNANIKCYVGEDTLEQALHNSEIVIGAGGLLRKPGIIERVWLANNTAFVKSLAKGVARLRPMPFVGVLTDPMNTLVPMAAEVIRTQGDYDSRKLFGITNIDALRAKTLYAANHKLDHDDVSVPVIGGHSDKTCIPLLSHAQPASDVNEAIVQQFLVKLRNIDDDIMKAKKGFSPVLSIAYSAFLFTRSVLDALDGTPATVNALVENNDFGTGFFAGLVHIDHEGVKEMQRYYNLTGCECALLETSIQELRRDILTGHKMLEYAC